MRNVFNNLKISNEEALKNLFIENLANDPNPVQIGRIWYNTTEDNYKYSTIDLLTNDVIIKHFPTIADIEQYILNLEINSSSIVLENSGNNNNVLFNLPTGSTIEESINLIAAEITNIKTFLNSRLINVSEFYFTSPYNTITLNHAVRILVLLINGLEQPESCYTIFNRSITFQESLPIGSFVKIICSNSIT